MTFGSHFYGMEMKNLEKHCSTTKVLELENELTSFERKFDWYMFWDAEFPSGNTNPIEITCITELPKQPFQSCIYHAESNHLIHKGKPGLKDILLLTHTILLHCASVGFICIVSLYEYTKPWESRHGSSEACSCHWACSGTTDHCHWYNRSQPDTQGPLGLCYKLSTDCQAHQQTTFPTLDKNLRTVSSLWRSRHSSKQGVELETQTRVVLAGLVSRFQTFHPKFPRPQVVTHRLCGLPDYPELQHLRGRACELRRTCRKGFNMIFFWPCESIGSYLSNSWWEWTWYRNPEKMQAGEWIGSLRNIESLNNLDKHTYRQKLVSIASKELILVWCQ